MVWTQLGGLTPEPLSKINHYLGLSTIYFLLIRPRLGNQAAPDTTLWLAHNQKETQPQTEIWLAWPGRERLQLPRLPLVGGRGGLWDTRVQSRGWGQKGSWNCPPGGWSCWRRLWNEFFSALTWRGHVLPSTLQGAQPAAWGKLVTSTRPGKGLLQPPLPCSHTCSWLTLLFCTLLTTNLSPSPLDLSFYTSLKSVPSLLSLPPQSSSFLLRSLLVLLQQARIHPRYCHDNRALFYPWKTL